MEKKHTHIVRFFVIATAIVILFSNVQAMKRKAEEQSSSSSSSSSSGSSSSKRQKIDSSKDHFFVLLQEATERIPFMWEVSFHHDGSKRTIYFDKQTGITVENKENGSKVENQEKCVVAYENFKENDNIVVYACNHVFLAYIYDAIKKKNNNIAICSLCRKPDTVIRTKIERLFPTPEQLSEIFLFIENTEEKEAFISEVFKSFDINLTSMHPKAYQQFFENCLRQAPLLTGEFIAIVIKECQKEGYDFSFFIENVGIEKMQHFLDKVPSILNQQEKIDIFSLLIPSLIDKKEDESEEARLSILENFLKKIGSLDDETEGFSDTIHTLFYQQLEKIKIPCHKALELLLKYRFPIKNESDPKNNTLFLFLSSMVKKYSYIAGINSAIDMSVGLRESSQKCFDDIKECIMLLIKFGCNAHVKIDYALHDTFLQEKVIADNLISSHFIAIPYTSEEDWLTAAPRSFIDIFTDETAEKYTLKHRFFTHNTTQEFRAEIITIFNDTPINQNYSIESANQSFCMIQ